MRVRKPRGGNENPGISMRFRGVCGDGGNRNGGPKSQRKMGAQFLVRHYSATRISGIYGPNHPASGQAAEACRAGRSA